MYNQSSIEAIRQHLVQTKQTIAVAESVTAGHLQAALSSGEEASHYFQGGITAYNAGQKTRHLNIEPVYAIAVNCVAEKIAARLGTALDFGSRS